MKIAAVVAVLLLAASAAALAADHAPCDHAKCPRMAKPLHRADVDHRHDDVTGVGHEGAVHHFLLAPDGGTIRLEVTDAKATADRDRIREHLQTIARAFAAGDFDMPMLIHDQVPPGVEVMKEKKHAI